MVSPAISQYVESEAKIRSIKLSAQNTFTYTDDYYGSGSYYSNKVINRKNQLHLEARINQKNYNGTNYVNLEAGYSYDYYHVNYDEYYNNHNDSDEDNSKYYKLYLEGGFGLGKVRNVTPVIRALRFKKRFNSIGKGTMDRQEVEALARVMAKNPGYRLCI